MYLRECNPSKYKLFVENEEVGKLTRMSSDRGILTFNRSISDNLRKRIEDAGGRFDSLEHARFESFKQAIIKITGGLNSQLASIITRCTILAVDFTKNRLKFLEV